MKLLLFALVAAGLDAQILLPITGGIGAGGGGLSHSFGLQFNGTSDYANSSAAVTLSGTRLSWSFWLYQNSFASVDALAGESSTNFYPNMGSFMLDTASGGGPFAYFAGHGAAVSSQCALAANPSAATWHHWMLTMDFTTTTTVCTAYIDGSSVTVTASNAGGATGAATSYTVYLMSRAGSSLFNGGRMADFAIYQGILTATDATRLAAGALANAGTISLSPVSYLHFCAATSPQADVMTNSWNWAITGTTQVAGPSALINCP